MLVADSTSRYSAVVPAPLLDSIAATAFAARASPSKRVKSKMLARALLRARQLHQVPARTMAAIPNWKMPTMEEYGVPTEPWQQVYDRNNKKRTLQLAASLTFFIITLFVAKTSGVLFLNTTPYHLMQNKKN